MRVDIRNRSQLERTAGHVLRAAISARDLQLQGFEQVSHSSTFADVPTVYFETDALLKGTMRAHKSLLADSKIAGNNTGDLAAIRLKQDIHSAPEKIKSLKNRFWGKVLDETSRLILLGLDL